MSDISRTNCPNCGAPLNRFHKCDYCSTIVPAPQPKARCGIEQTADRISFFYDYNLLECGTEVWAGEEKVAFIPSENYLTLPSLEHTLTALCNKGVLSVDDARALMKQEVRSVCLGS